MGAGFGVRAMCDLSGKDGHLRHPCGGGNTDEGAAYSERPVTCPEEGCLPLLRAWVDAKLLRDRLKPERVGQTRVGDYPPAITANS